MSEDNKSRVRPLEELREELAGKAKDEELVSFDRALENGDKVTAFMVARRNGIELRD